MIIRIRDLEFKCIIGILDFERVSKQRVIVDVKIEYSYLKENYINYADVSALIKKVMKKRKFLLLEDALKSLSGELKQNFSRIDLLTLEISKPDILRNCIVSVKDKYKF
ncbi:MAG: FolB domain-containing protein [Helicobacteraceae bacterium]|nr:FolB domain-containing protein [Helicobacteraceae bacterium]